LNSFKIGKYLVTQQQWEAVMGHNPSYFKGHNMPVERVTWNEVQEFIKKLNALTGKNYRLPTEAEWEYAARGGNKSKGYKYSGSNDIDAVAWYSDNGNMTTHLVGEKAPNELGIYDMSGNVLEWCSDWYGAYTDNPQTDPPGAPTGTRRILRGGAVNLAAFYCRVSYRMYMPPNSADAGRGFRLVLP
jgi:formylglycine-generating enzyme required for sulfatase activity